MNNHTKSPLPEKTNQTAKTNRRLSNFWYILLAIIFAIGLFLIWQIIGGVVLGIYAASTGHNVEEYLANIENDTFGSFIFSLVAYGGMLISVVAGLKLFKLTKKDIGLIKKFNISNLGWAIIILIVYYVVLLSVMGLINLYIPSIDLDQKQEIGFSATYKTPIELVVIFASIVILPAIVEEVMMRGFLYSALKSRLSLYIATILTSVIFGLAHLQLGSGSAPLWAAAIDTMILSIFLIYLREKTGSLWSGMIIHALKNSLAFLFLFVITT